MWRSKKQHIHATPREQFPREWLDCMRTVAAEVRVKLGKRALLSTFARQQER